MESDEEEIDVVGLDEDDIYPTNNILIMENLGAIQNIDAHEAGVENLLYQPMHQAHPKIVGLPNGDGDEPTQAPKMLPRRVTKPKAKSSAKKHKNAKPKSGTSQKTRKQQNGYQGDCEEADNKSGPTGNGAAGKKNIVRKHGASKKDDNKPAENGVARKKTPYKKRHYKKRNTSPQPKYKLKVDRVMAGAPGPLCNPKRNCRAQCNRCGIDLNDKSWCKLCGINPFTDESDVE